MLFIIMSWGENNLFNDCPGGSLPFNYVQELNFPSWSSIGGVAIAIKLTCLANLINVSPYIYKIKFCAHLDVKRNFQTLIAHHPSLVLFN